ncbi:NAD(P)-dependent glycerol-3-phosphate dehydrogenase [Kaistia dalseonensis]|uniref:Glycerol-3-phosphate dehydrogenase [NAD(P)+] n=1 Tax=Kaistia dalseonensis TaxID=410840 RepID=A0ABU0H5I2_9HYPH|nr:NAD(P)H-dependent glycerol-3-phosphate dehydrogenase [Kaistia dalseonensis]MCX5494711.1 NAD(P)-dependent glycerol-3-phosphate dehydrogenase [Kaistia dalseonensis]MDQ0437292.1 glycerol-3-phosphate dehydrogenase (NAD(P)+) [Kaistia dalseonensis]
MTIERVAIVGAGAWGTALALAAERAGRSVVLWGRDIGELAATRENSRHLPGIVLPAAIEVTDDLARAVTADAILLVTPTQTVRAVARRLAGIADDTPVVICAKGLERSTMFRPTEVLEQALPPAAPAVLSGPSFAADVARGLPTAVTIAAAEPRLAMDICQALGSISFRPYAETDIIGVEIGGAFKNVLAIAAGIVTGRRLGASASAALVARGFAELRRIGAAMGARPETLMGLSGLGDLVLTSSSPQSRNFAFGVALGQGADPARVLVEGASTAPVARELARVHQVEMPITEAVAAIVEGEVGIDEAIGSLMSRPLKHETD